MQLTSFVGRDDDIEGLAKALTEARLVTLTGVGGVGKTRLALQVAAEVLPRFSDGVWFCELAATNDADLLAQVVVAALAVQSRAGAVAGRERVRLPGGQAGVDRAGQLRASPGRGSARSPRRSCAPRRGCGCWPRAGSRSASPGSGCWGCRPCASRQSPSLEAIAACEAVQLFMERAEATRSGLQLDATNAEQIVEICRRLDAIPLAIELAAARVTSMSPAEIAGLLDERFRLLTGGRRRGIERHQTLRATVEWSYSLLDERERVVFDRLGVFAGASTPTPPPRSRATTSSRPGMCATRSMTWSPSRWSSSTTALTRTTRYRLLETLRQYALERLDDTGHTEEHRRRHAEHYATFAEAAGPGLEGPDEAAWFPRFDVELDNLRAAVAWALDAEARDDAELGLRIIAPLTRQAVLSPVCRCGRMGRSRSRTCRDLDPRPPCRRARRRGLEGDLRMPTSTSRARVPPRHCATGSPRHPLPRIRARRARE